MTQCWLVLGIPSVRINNNKRLSSSVGFGRFYVERSFGLLIQLPRWTTHGACLPPRVRFACRWFAGLRIPAHRFRARIDWRSVALDAPAYAPLPWRTAAYGPRFYRATRLPFHAHLPTYVFICRTIRVLARLPCLFGLPLPFVLACSVPRSFATYRFRLLPPSYPGLLLPPFCYWLPCQFCSTTVLAFCVPQFSTLVKRFLFAAFTVLIYLPCIIIGCILVLYVYVCVYVCIACIVDIVVIVIVDGTLVVVIVVI